MTQPASTLPSSNLFAPSAEFAARAHIKSRAELDALRAAADVSPESFWGELGSRYISWQNMFDTVLDSAHAPHYRWFCGGTLNVSYNCLDRHLQTRGHRTAIIFEAEDTSVRHLTYAQLHAEVCKFANALRDVGVEKGDRVAVLLPHSPEAVIAMQACARIGAIHTVIFAGFSADSLRDRVDDTGAKVIVTADAFVRGGRTVALKSVVDAALAEGCKSVKSVIVRAHSATEVAMTAGRDVWWHELMSGASPSCAPVWVESEHPLFILYTSGSTGKPKGIVHTSAGYLLGAMTSMQWSLDLRADDVYWCTADVGWVTGHTYVAYGPLALGATLVMYEGGPTTPTADRFWQICARHGVTVFYTAPTAVRALMRHGDALPKQHDLRTLRLLGCVGEPINPEAWMWLRDVIGGGRCPVVDTWWQTETGAIMIAPVPGAIGTKPGSCTLPLPGIDADIVDDDGEPLAGAGAGALVIKRPWPSMMRTVWGDDARYAQTYWNQFGGRYYVAGDRAQRDADGYFWILGRLDDVLNVSGHRLGTAEIEAALAAHPDVAEAAVVGRPDDIKGESVFAYVVLNGAPPTADEIDIKAKALRNWVGSKIGAHAKPDTVRFTPALPKTRSGKVMRRLLRTIARGGIIEGDVSTLDNQGVLEHLTGIVSSQCRSLLRVDVEKRTKPA